MIDHILALLKEYPEVVSIGCGVILSACIVVLLDVVYFPSGWSFRKCQQVAVTINLPLGTAISYGLWRFLDPADPRWFDLWVSAASVAGSPVLLYVASKVLSWKWPSMNLSFGLLRNRDDTA